MTVRDLVHVGDPVLRVPTTPVELTDIGSPRVQDLIDDLVDTMRAANGAGIAAPQVGSSLRVAIAEVRADTTHQRYPYKPEIPLTVLVNPVLEPVGDTTEDIIEGCLSVPGLRGEVARHERIRVSWHDREGTPHSQEFAGVTAGTFQHECDHLDGRVFLDRVSDTTTLTTWDNYRRHHRAAFEARMRDYVARTGS